MSSYKKKMSSGQFVPRYHSQMILERCRNKQGIDKVVIDVDEDEILGSSDQGISAESSREQKDKNEKSSDISVINIEDEESNDGCEHEKNADTGTSSSYFSDDDECIIERKKSPCKLPKKEFCSIGQVSKINCSFSNYFEKHTIPSFEVGTSESFISDSDSSDCEIVSEAYVTTRKEWERAASKKRAQDRAHISVSGDDAKITRCELEPKRANINYNKYMPSQENASNFCSVHPSKSSVKISSEKTAKEFPTQDPVPDEELTNEASFPFGKDVFSESNFWSERNNQDVIMENSSTCAKQPDEVQIPGSPGPRIINENLPSKAVNKNEEHPNIIHRYGCFQPNHNQTIEKPSTNTSDVHQTTKEISSSSLLESKQIAQKETGEGGISSEATILPTKIQEYLIGDREKLKESDEYKRAQEEEWASRQQQLRIQSEEARKQRRRKKAEAMRLLDMETRQKQRLEEVRKSQKKVEETINMKEKYRAEIRKKLEKMEVIYPDMASLLRALGIPVAGGCLPLAHEVNAAYKKALLKFHPDRVSRDDIQQQVESEEKFKMISRLKEKLLAH